MSAIDSDKTLAEMAKLAEPLEQEDPGTPEEAIHLFFELSYANYLVINRSILQSMPNEWQHRFVLMLRELQEEFGWAQELQPGIEVKILQRRPEIIEEEQECEHCEGSSNDPENPEEECPECVGGKISIEGDRYETGEEVGYRSDPVAYYNRGRTQLPAASMSVEEVEEGYFEMKREWLKAVHPTVFKREWITAGAEVEVIHHPDHTLPDVLEHLGGTFDGTVSEVLDNDIYKVKIRPLDEVIEVHLHIDQIEVA